MRASIQLGYRIAKTYEIPVFKFSSLHPKPIIISEVLANIEHLLKGKSRSPVPGAGMRPARRWCQSGNLTGLGVQPRAVGTHPRRGGSSPVPLPAGGTGDRTWREAAAGRREGAVRRGAGHVCPLGPHTSRAAQFPEAAGGVPRPLSAPPRVPRWSPAAMRVQVKVNAGPAPAAPSPTSRRQDSQLQAPRKGSSGLLATSATGSSGGLEREGASGRWGRLGEEWRPWSCLGLV